MGQFGSTLKTLLNASNLKYVQLAQEIRFDASYISKWVNSAALPSHKTIDSIIDKLAAYVVDILDDAGHAELCLVFDYDIPEDGEGLYKYLSRLLSDAYEHDLREKELFASDTSLTQTTASSSHALGALSQSVKVSRKNILQGLALFRKRSDEIEVSVLGNVLNFPLNDVLFLMDIHYEIERLEFKKSTFIVQIPHGAISATHNESSNVAFLNWMHLHTNGEVQFCENDFIGTGLILHIKDLVLFEAQMLYQGRWALVTCSWNQSINSDFEYSLKQKILLSGKPLFIARPSLSPAYTASCDPFFSGYYDKVLTGLIDMFLLKEETLIACFEHYPSMTEEQKRYCLKRHRYFWHKVDGGTEIQYLLYRQALDRLSHRGVMRILDREITLPSSLRHRVLTDVYENSQRAGIEVKFIDKFLVNAIKHVDLPNLYLARSKSYFISFPVEKQLMFNTIADATFHQFLLRLFDSLYHNQLVLLVSAEEVIPPYIELSYEQSAFDQFEAQ